MLADVIANAKNYERNLVRKGRLEGRVEGVKAKALEMAKKMFIDGKSIDEIIKYTELTAKEIQDLEKTLKQS